MQTEFLNRSVLLVLNKRIFTHFHTAPYGHQSFTKHVNPTNIRLYTHEKKKKVQFPTEHYDKTILSEMTYQKRQYFCKHAVSSILSQPHEEGKSLIGKFTVHRRLFVNEVKFLFDNISHIS